MWRTDEDLGRRYLYEEIIRHSDCNRYTDMERKNEDRDLQQSL